MTLATLANIPSSQESFWQFSFANVDEHRKIFQAIKKQYGISLQEYIIDPVAPWDFPAWAYRHQNMHNEQNAILGIIGNDLTSVDPSKPDQWAAWTWQHESEHYQAALKLGIN